MVKPLKMSGKATSLRRLPPSKAQDVYEHLKTVLQEGGKCKVLITAMFLNYYNFSALLAILPNI